MDLLVVFGFVTTLVLIIMGAVVLHPISRKLGYFLEQAARDRAESLTKRVEGALPPPRPDETLQALSDLQDAVAQIAERQAFTEQLLERRLDPPSDASQDSPT